MIVLDENIIKNQCQLLRSWRIPFRQIGFNIGEEGLKDKNIISLLHELKNPTFFTRDDDFFNKDFCHAKYCIVYLAVKKEESAIFIRRLLHHKEFNTIKKRTGHIIRVTHSGLTFFSLHIEKQIHYSW